MNSLALDKIVNALLYEGYILYPYRASSRKNRQRFTFGRIYPHIYSLAQGEAEPFVMQTECLFRHRGEVPALEVEVRFLHPMAREVSSLSKPLAELPVAIGPEDFRSVQELRVDHILFSVDWPFAPNKPATEWLHRIPFSAGDRAKIANGNARRLLKL